MFNKLEVALRQGLHAGPAAVAPKRDGLYIKRPIYNLYGMGIGSSVFEYKKEEMYSLMLNNGTVPPGHFWCEFLSGEHLSIDYNQDIYGFWHTRSVWAGCRKSLDNLTRFDSWVRLDVSAAPQWDKTALNESFLYDRDVPVFNMETIGGKAIEIHPRLGNDPFDDLPVGTEIIPVWNDEEAPEGEWRGNLHQDMTMYSANGHLKDVRRGFVVRRP